jgi:osmoprotectant transport system ATP-binding protein
MPAPAVSFESVRVDYAGGVSAVAEVTLDIAGGSFVALVGGSGSGKTTLLKTINRLIAPTAGRITIDGRDVADGDAHALRRRIGYVFQNVGLFPHLDVAANIGIGARIAGGRLSPERTAELLALVELDPALASRMPDQLSGGQRQRVGVARALACGPKLMLMDEPFGALDAITRDALARTTRRLHDSLHLTTIMVTHDMAEALLTADRVLVMADGRIVADATPEELLAGAGGEVAAALVAVPREQARRLAELEGRA